MSQRERLAVDYTVAVMADSNSIPDALAVAAEAGVHAIPSWSS